MRTFIAIELPKAVKEALGALSNRLRRSGAKATWVQPENVHLTLRFLGDVSESVVNKLGERLAVAYQDLEPFTLSMARTGAFPNLRRPRVIWVGVGPLEGGLAEAQAIAEEAAVWVGLAPEKRRFQPHLTVARIRDARELGGLPMCLAQEADFAGGEFVVENVSLFSSRLTPNGPVYRRLKEFCL